MKTPQDFVASGHGSVEAFVEPGEILAAGMQDLARQFAATAQVSMEEAVSTLRTMSGIRAFQQAVELQTILARTAVKEARPQAGQVAETSVKLAGDAIAPVAGRMTPQRSKAPRPPEHACPDCRADGPRPCPAARRPA